MVRTGCRQLVTEALCQCGYLHLNYRLLFVFMQLHGSIAALTVSRLDEKIFGVNTACLF